MKIDQKIQAKNYFLFLSRISRTPQGFLEENLPPFRNLRRHRRMKQVVSTIPISIYTTIQVNYNKMTQSISIYTTIRGQMTRRFLRLSLMRVKGGSNGCYSAYRGDTIITPVIPFQAVNYCIRKQSRYPSV